MRSDLFAALLGTAIVCTAPAVASPTTFTYQGQLVEDGTPAEGAHEFEIRLLDNLGVQIGMTLTASEIVTAGSFAMQLDFGVGAFDGSDRFLEISVRSVADGGAYTTLTPNQLVTSAPVAQFALSGNEGPQGPAGSQGNQGVQGDPGADGAPGPQGDPGNDGSDGAPGAQGPQGNQGVAGTPGDSHWAINGPATYYNGGRVGIGIFSPLSKLHVNSISSESALRVQHNNVTRLHVNSNSGVSLGGFSSSVAGGNVYAQNNMGIGVESPTDRLHVSALDGEDAFRVQHDGLTRIRVNANGGVSLGGNSTIIGAGDTYVVNKLGVGTNNPGTQVDIESPASLAPLRVAVGSNRAFLVGTDANLYVDHGIGINTSGSLSFELAVDGTAAKTGGGSWAVYSDQRLKKNITSMTGSLDTISALRPVNFEYTAKDHFSYTPGMQSGFIAQEVQQVIPQWVNIADDGYFYLDQKGYEALIVDAIQELRAEKDAEIERLQARLDRLERMMAASINQ